MNLFKIESYRKGIAISTTFNFFSKIIGFANSIVVAYYFGTQGKTDVYIYSFATIGLIAAFLTNLNGLVLIPESMRIREQEGLLDSMYFLNIFIFFFLFLGLMTSLILFLNPLKSFVFFSKFDINLLSNNMNVLYCVIPMLTLMIMSSLLTDILVSFKYFTLPMIAGTINSVLSMTFVLIFHSTLDILSITSGFLLGYTLNTIILIILLKRQLKWKFAIRKIKIRKLVIKNIFYAQAGNLTTIMGTYIPLYLVSGFNQGIVTALNYGRNISSIPDSLLTTQFSSIFGIKSNEIFASRDLDRANHLFLSSMDLLFYILIPIALIMSFFSNEIVTILYMRGKFNRTSVELTSQFLRYFALSLPFIALNTMSSRIITAGQKISINFYAGVVLNGIYLILLYFAIKIFGPIGYPVALLIFLPMSTFVANYFIFKKYFNYIKFYLIITHFFKVLIFYVILGIPFALFYNAYMKDMKILFSLTIICVLYICMTLITNVFLKINGDIILFQKRLILLLKKNGDN